MFKGTLGLRPNFHQIEQRVEAHIFISVPAYHLLCRVRHQMDKASDPREWRTLRRLLSTRLPLEDGRIVTVRKPSLPDTEQAHVYQILGIDWKRVCPAVKSALKATAVLKCLCKPILCFIGAAGRKRLRRWPPRSQRA